MRVPFIVFCLRPWSYNEVIQKVVRNLMDVHILVIKWHFEETIHMGVATGNSINIHFIPFLQPNENDLTYEKAPYTFQ